MMKNFLKGVGIGVLSIASIELFNRIINENSKKYKLNIDEGYYYTWKEGSVHYNIKGEGSPILLIHDLNVISSEYEWNKIVDDLTKNHKVYTIDLLGCGLSDKPDITYTNYTFVQIISDFCKDVIKEKCDVITSNDSSSVAIMAQKINDIFNKIILINPAPFDIFAMETTRLDLIEKKILYLPIIGKTLYNYHTSQKNIQASLENYMYNTSDLENLTEACYEASHYSNSKGRYLYACKKCSYVTVDVRPALSELENVYIITGDKNYSSIADEYKKINPDIKSTSIDNSGCLPHIENANATLKEIIKYIN